MSVTQETTSSQEEELYRVIANEHAKQVHWKETLKIETEQAVAEKKKQFKAGTAQEEKQALDRKSKCDAQTVQEETARKMVVQEMMQNVAAGAGEMAINSVAKTLSEFLSKLLTPFFSYQLLHCSHFSF